MTPSPGAATEPALVPAGSSMVTDSKINADDTGRLVSGTDSAGNTIPPDTFVGAVSDVGPIALSSNASVTTASNNYAKPWIGTFQLLNDSGQPVSLPNGFNGNVTLSAEGATSTVGSTDCPSGDEAATTAGCVTADPLFDPTDFTPGGGDTGTVLISPLIKPGTVSSTYYNHYSTLRTLEDLFLTGKSCTNPSNADTPLVAGTVCGGLDGQGHIGYAAQPGLASFGPDVFTAQHFSAVDGASRLHSGRRQRRDGAVLPGGHVSLGSAGPQRQAGIRLLRRERWGRPGHPVAALAAATAVTAATGPRASAHGGNGGNGGNGACPPEEWVNGTWLTRGPRADDTARHAAMQRHGGNGGAGGRVAMEPAPLRVGMEATAGTDRPATPARRVAERTPGGQAGCSAGGSPVRHGLPSAQVGPALHARPGPARSSPRRCGRARPRSGRRGRRGRPRRAHPRCRGRRPRTTPRSSRRTRSIRRSTPR